MPVSKKVIATLPAVPALAASVVLFSSAPAGEPAPQISLTAAEPGSDDPDSDASDSEDGSDEHGSDDDREGGEGSGGGGSGGSAGNGSSGGGSSAGGSGATRGRAAGPATNAGDWESRAAALVALLEQSDDPRAAELAEQLAALGITAENAGPGPATGGRSGRKGRSGGGGAADTGEASVPADLFDMDRWKLTLPGGREGDPTEILPRALRSFTKDGIFQLTPERDGVVFRAEVGGATTKNSDYPRSELREMAGGKKEAAWSNTSGTHTLRVRQAITEVPPVKPHVVAAQIHDGNDDVLQIRLEGKSLAVQYNDGNDQVVIDPAYELGTPYDLEIVAGDGGVVVFYDGERAAELPLEGSNWYFKVGAYTQSNPGKGDERGAAGEVVVYDVAIDHGGGAAPSRRPR